MSGRQRFPVSADRSSGMVTRPLGQRQFEVEQSTGYSISTVPNARWKRDAILRGETPILRPRREPVMYDPTDPRTHPQARI